MAGATIDRVELGARGGDLPPGYRTRAGRAAPAPRRNIARRLPRAPTEGAPPTEWSVRVAGAAALLAEAGVRGAAVRDVGAGEHFPPASTSTSASASRASSRATC